METVIGTILSYLVSLAASLRTDAILERRRKSLDEQLRRKDDLRKAIASTHSIRDEIHIACVELARNRARFGVTKQEEPLWRLLSDEIFQADLAEWLMAGGIEEGNAVKNRLLQTMEDALNKAGASQEQITFLKTDYFDALDKAVFAHPTLANWRHQLGLGYLREQVAVLQRRAEEAAGVYSPEKQKAALDSYCKKALATWDIIDLSNLPEGDIHMATQKLLLRQLYLPLRIVVEPSNHGEDNDAVLRRLEEQREVRRHREAGHFFKYKPDQPEFAESRSSVGECLATFSRLVVLGDPGSGKTTMVRWMATAYLLRHKGDDAFSQIPDNETLPDRSWIPVLIRCRDIGEADLCRCFTDFLAQHLKKTELLPEEADVMRTVILDRIAKGEALVLVDGLDEITNPHVRMMFCQELERTAVRYPNAPIVITSRIVGYRDMPYRMGSGFEHSVIAELNRKDKDLFAQRWVEVTEQHHPPAEKNKRVQELLHALHSSDRIERLTGNPMLLTTLALVKRKVGKLPNRRNKLYAEAVSVLLNWNPRLYQTIEEEEAIPQLGYLAYEMCRRGVQRLTDDEVLDLLEKVRTEYPNIRAIRRQEPQKFLELLEARSSILIKSGDIWQKNKTQEMPVWEFRHLTFQEYLAARALLDGRYPDRDKTKSLAEQVASLAGTVEKVMSERRPEKEVEVPESWREALQLLVVDCKDDDVDDVLLAILNPLPGEEAANTSRPRAVLAALCLADEPNVSEDTATLVLAEFADNVKRSLIGEYCRRPAQTRFFPGSLWGMVEVACWGSGYGPTTGFGTLVERLQSPNRVEALSAALAVMEAAFEQKATNVPGLEEHLFLLLGKGGAESLAAAWALLWLSGGFGIKQTPTWLPSETELGVLINALSEAPDDEGGTMRFLIFILGKVSNEKATKAIISKLDHPDTHVRMAVIEALGQLGDKQAVPLLLTKLDHPDTDVRMAVGRALGQLGDKQAVPLLLTKLDDPDTHVRMAVGRALGQLGDKQAVPLLLTKLDHPDTHVRMAVIEALGQLGDKQAVPLLLTKLDDPDTHVRMAVGRALGQLGDKQAIETLILLLEDPDYQVCVAAAVALTGLGADRGSSALTEFLNHGSPERRKAAVKELVIMRGKPKERTLLSLDFDGIDPWIDPITPITKTRLVTAARKLGITTQEARSLYESIAADFHLRFA
jgi:HEAT repeat protein